MSAPALPWRERPAGEERHFRQSAEDALRDYARREGASGPLLEIYALGILTQAAISRPMLNPEQLRGIAVGLRRGTVLERGQRPCNICGRAIPASEARAGFLDCEFCKA